MTGFFVKLRACFLAIRAIFDMPFTDDDTLHVFYMGYHMNGRERGRTVVVSTDDHIAHQISMDIEEECTCEDADATDLSATPKCNRLRDTS